MFLLPSSSSKYKYAEPPRPYYLSHVGTDTVRLKEETNSSGIMAKLCNGGGYSKAALARVVLTVLCLLQVETSLAARVDKRSIALPVKSLKRTDNGPSYIAELRVLNAKYMTLACSVCRSYANHVKKQLKESSKTKPVDMEVTVGWRMDERKKINYHTSIPICWTFSMIREFAKRTIRRKIWTNVINMAYVHPCQSKVK